MAVVLPLEVKLAALREMILLVKENGGSAPISEIARDSKEDIGGLFPVLEAGKLLGLMEVSDGVVKLSEVAKNANQKDLKTFLRTAMMAVEPFKSIVGHLKKTHGASTTSLFDFLLENGLVGQADRVNDINDFRRELLRLLIRTEICKYDSRKDVWKLL